MFISAVCGFQHILTDYLGLLCHAPESMQHDTVVPGIVTCHAVRRQDMTRREQYGHVINISSMSAHRVPNGASGGSFYAATKHALRALTEGLRQEVRLHLRALKAL